ncbi:MAG: PIN domain-containing protein [Candidatus Aminicenantes bacterium]|nr:PIN domain-containing protein [Candidatus Aminicenantes bacterium]
MSAEKILIDTSIWIDYFQNKSSIISEKVDKILSENEVFVPKIVIAELILGAKSEKEISIIEDFLDAFHIVDQKEDTWLKAGRLSYDLKKKGKTINILDCYIAAMAQEHECKIFTLNRHFKEIQSIADISLIDS